MVSDGSGGAIIVWQDNRNGNSDIYAQRVDASGLTLWQSDDVPVCTANGVQGGMNQIKILPDNFGGAIINWWDFRSGDPDIYTQRINTSGLILWQAGGIPVCNAVNWQAQPEAIVIDSNVVMTWVDSRNQNGTYLNGIYTQKISLAGVTEWPINGVMLVDASAGIKEFPILAGTGDNIFVAWYAAVMGEFGTVYRQKLNSAGCPQLPATSVVYFDVG